MQRALLILTACGWLGCSKVSISEMRPGSEGSQLMCWLTLSFGSPPKGADPRDVKVSFASIVLDEEKAFGWDYLSENDYLVKTEKTWLGDQDRFVLDASTTAESDPSNHKMKVKFVMDSKSSVQAGGYTDVTLDATVYWAGQKQDQSKRGLFLVYQKK